jgi:hypothetical protein
VHRSIINKMHNLLPVRNNQFGWHVDIIKFLITSIYGIPIQSFPLYTKGKKETHSHILYMTLLFKKDIQEQNHELLAFQDA